MPLQHAVRTQADILDLEREPFEARLPRPVSTYASLERQALRTPDARALTFVPSGDPRDGDVSYSYRELVERVRQVANALSRLGVGRGDVVSYVLPNIPETHFVLWGAEAVGIVSPINPLLEIDHIAAILNAANAGVLVAFGRTSDSGIWEKIEALRHRIASLHTIVRVGGDDDCPAWAVDLDALLAHVPEDRLIERHGAQPNATASYFHTGGTTGTPKIAKRSHRNEVANAWAIATMIDMGVADVMLCGLPLFHSNAMMVTGLAPFSVGAHVVLLSPTGYRNPRTIASFWRSVERYEATMFSAVPTVLSALLGVERQGETLSSLRFAICGAAPLSVELFGRFENATGIRLLEGYGMTEATCVSSLNPRDGERRIGSIGLRLPYQEMKVARLEDDRIAGVAAVDEIGTILLRGPYVFDGYLQPEADRGVLLEDGWLNTGDLGRCDADGYFWLTGRAKDLIIRGGHNIDPAMIEEGMMRHPLVELAAAVGKPDARAGELPVVFVTLRSGARRDDAELLAHARAAIPERAAVPVDVFVIDAMPLTAVNKIFKPALRERAIAFALENVVRSVCGPVDVVAAVAPHARFGVHAQIAVALEERPDRAQVISRTEAELGKLPIHWTAQWTSQRDA